MSMQKPFYEKFVKKTASPQTQDKADHVQSKESRQNHQSKDKKQYTKVFGEKLNQKNEKLRGSRNSTPYTFGKPVFSGLTSEAKNILEYFPMLLDQVLPLDAKKKQLLPQHIHTLFHELTDERSSRKTHYLNDPVKLSAYTHYYVWWNLVRLTKLLQNLEIPLDDGDYAADFGSGPLTLVCALWIAKPKLRKKRLTWYCVDISNKALSFGEELFLALCAYTGKKDNGEIPWTVKKVCGAFGTPLSEKVSLITEANMFNEIFWNSSLSLDDQAEKTHRTVMHYLKPAGSVLFIEPGIPLAGEFLSLLRTEFVEAGFSIYAPCPHVGVCCFPNRPLQTGTAKMPIAFHKWCHFTFETHDSPENLLRLSEASHLGKERASLSFLYGTLSSSALSSGNAEKASSEGIPVRICSDIIKPDPQTIGRYACSEKGFMFITGHAYKESVLNTAVSGTLLILPEEAVKFHQRDKKTHALLVEVP